MSGEQVLRLHAHQIHNFGGSSGLRDRGALEAAVARPRATFGGEDLYADFASKAAALMHSLVMNHPFVDGNKRVGAMAAELFVEINERSLLATDEEFEEITLSVARGELDAESLAIWFRQRISSEESYLAEYADYQMALKRLRDKNEPTVSSVDMRKRVVRRKGARRRSRSAEV